MKCLLLSAALLAVTSPAAAQSTIPADLPNRLTIALERPDVPNAHLSLTFERVGAAGRLTGCQTAAEHVGCRATRRLELSPAQVRELVTRWRNLAAGARCRIRRPTGHWAPFRLTWIPPSNPARTPSGAAESLEGVVWEHADERLSARCFATERVGGWFLRVWRDA